MRWLLSLLLIPICYLFLLRGKKDPLDPFQGKYYAHRGLYDDRIPENSLAAFSLAFDRGYGIEFDVHLLKDGSLAILHDSALSRMTGKTGILEGLTKDDLPHCHLKGTDQCIPTFSQVLDLCGGRQPLIIELKTQGGNADALTEAVCQALRGYEGPFCLESFDPRCLLWLKRHRPELIRGQLSENFLKQEHPAMPWPLRFAASYHLETFLTRPHFIAHKFKDRKNLSVFLIRRLYGIQGITWTVDTEADFHTALQEGWIPIFERIRP